ncbi:MAG: hypothetical protein IM526_02605 [Microcystis sp. M38BS1]|uniref:hypothetical protein n=1 Tax=Microcystis sp. M38BS1 TaxID=2771188 RepID=UPI0031FD8066|nr:hypothetical protein [Microcystis sp. M38BS1]MCA6582551.1 hypothetical protein [Pseudanabaena sp. M34BS1SP1A06MG]
MQDTLQSLQEELNKNCAITEYLNQQQKEHNANYVKLLRKKWWLLHPDIVEISYVAVYETDYSYSTTDPSYPAISWRSAINQEGKNVAWLRDTSLFLPLESEITDEETVITVRNPYISQSPKGCEDLVI